MDKINKFENKQKESINQINSLTEPFKLNNTDIGKIYYIDTNSLFLEMMKENYFSYDVFFRMAVIDEFFKNNDEIWNLYNKLQFTRAKLISRVPSNMVNHQVQFIELIKSMKEFGYDFNQPILVNKELYVIDGAHRMACALKYKIPKVAIYTTEEFINFTPNEYTKQWFIDHGLEECIPFAESQKEILEKRIKNV